MLHALFDPITNSEDEMILRAGIKRRDACTYLRAYIMASLCFEPQLVITDTAANLNQAFRALVDMREGYKLYNADYLPPKTDFEQLIRAGNIRFAARDAYQGGFSHALWEKQKDMENVDLPSESYTEKIDELTSDNQIYRYDTQKITQNFTSMFKTKLETELYRNLELPPQTAETIQKLLYIISGKETITYNGVKKILLQQFKLNESDDNYKDIRKILRWAYDYNVPEYLGLDYCMSLRDAKPDRQDWTLNLSYEQRLKCNFACNVYGFAALPAINLTYIWNSQEYADYKAQIDKLRQGIVDLEQYMEALEKYFGWINKVIESAYAQKYKREISYKIETPADLKVVVSHYCRACSPETMLVSALNVASNTSSLLANPFRFVLEKIIIPVAVQKSSFLNQPPTEMKEAIVMQHSAGN